MPPILESTEGGMRPRELSRILEVVDKGGSMNRGWFRDWGGFGTF